MGQQNAREASNDNLQNAVQPVADGGLQGGDLEEEGPAMQDYRRRRQRAAVAASSSQEHKNSGNLKQISCDVNIQKPSIAVKHIGDSAEGNER